MPGDAASADLVTESPLELGLDGRGNSHGSGAFLVVHVKEVGNAGL